MCGRRAECDVVLSLPTGVGRSAQTPVHAVARRPGDVGPGPAVPGRPGGRHRQHGTTDRQDRQRRARSQHARTSSTARSTRSPRSATPIVVGGDFTQANSGSGTSHGDPQQACSPSTPPPGKISPAFAPEPDRHRLQGAAGRRRQVGLRRRRRSATRPGSRCPAGSSRSTRPPVSSTPRSSRRPSAATSVTSSWSATTCSSPASSPTSTASPRRRSARCTPTPASATPTSTRCSPAPHNTNVAGAITNVLQISINKQNTQLMAVGNFTTVDGQNRHQIAKFDIGNLPTVVDPTVHQTLVAVVRPTCSPRPAPRSSTPT